MDECLLCTADRVTPWLHEDDECWVAECLVCRTPMVVWRTHGLPDAELEATLLGRLERIAGDRYGLDGFWIDPERRRIPDHWHAHARPTDGFFDPTSELYGRSLTRARRDGVSSIEGLARLADRRSAVVVDWSVRATTRRRAERSL